jgi:hypothetical protein
LVGCVIIHPSDPKFRKKVAFLILAQDIKLAKHARVNEINNEKNQSCLLLFNFNLNFFFWQLFLTGYFESYIELSLRKIIFDFEFLLFFLLIRTWIFLMPVWIRVHKIRIMLISCNWTCFLHYVNILHVNYKTILCDVIIQASLFLIFLLSFSIF